MSNRQKYGTANKMIPYDIFHPGYFLAEEMKAREMKQTELAEALGMSHSEMSLLINGKRNFTVPIALRLEKVFGISTETWVRFQMRYELDFIRKRMTEELNTIKISARKKATIRTVILHAV